MEPVFRLATSPGSLRARPPERRQLPAIVLLQRPFGLGRAAESDDVPVQEGAGDSTHERPATYADQSGKK
jgi:hypothetical protein